MLVHTARVLVFATLLVPVVLLPGYFFPFITVRAVFFRVLVELATAIVLYLVVRREVAFNFRTDPVLWALISWVAANALAAVFGAAPMRSIFGDHERMGGVWFWAHLLAYYLVLRTVMGPRDWRRYFLIAVGVAGLISIYGLIQHWVQPFWSPIGGLEAGATVGNPGLLAIYLLANIAFCALLAARAGRRARPAFVVLTLVIVLAMVLSGNRSSALALLIGSGVGLLAYAGWTGSLRGWRAAAIVTLFAVAGALPFVARAPWARPVTSRVQLLSKLSLGVDSTRVIQWRAAIEGIRDRPVLGVGPENYQLVWSRYYHPEMHRFLEDSRWDRAHNAYLDAFATAGILGFLSLLAIWIALGWTAHRIGTRPPIGNGGNGGSADDEGARPTAAVALGFFAAYAFYLVFWFFDLNSTMLWIALAAFIASQLSGRRLIEVGSVRQKRWQASMVVALGAVALVSVLYIHGFKTLEMARTLDRARNPNRPLHLMLEDFESIFASPAPITQHAFLMYAAQLRSLQPRFEEIRGDPTSSELFDRAFVLAVKEFESQAVQDPLNERLLVQHARVLMIGAAYYRNARLYESALSKLHRAVALAPRRITTQLVLGWAYLQADRPEEAVRIFERAYSVYPAFGRTQAYLATAHAALGNNLAAADWLMGALRAGFVPDRSAVIEVSRALSVDGHPLAGAKLIEAYLNRRFGPPFMWRNPTGRPAMADYELALIAAELYQERKDPASAERLTSAAEFLCVAETPLEHLASDLLKRSRVNATACREPWRRTIGN